MPDRTRCVTGVLWVLDCPALLQMIDTDLSRTFPSLSLFGPGQPLHSQVTRRRAGCHFPRPFACILTSLPASLFPCRFGMPLTHSCASVPTLATSKDCHTLRHWCVCTATHRKCAAVCLGCRRRRGMGQSPAPHGVVSSSRCRHRVLSCLVWVVIGVRFMSFQCLANLVMREHVFVFLQMDPSALKRYYSIYDRVLQTHNPKVFARLKQLDISNEMYLFPWLQVRGRAPGPCMHPSQHCALFVALCVLRVELCSCMPRPRVVTTLCVTACAAWLWLFVCLCPYRHCS